MSAFFEQPRVVQRWSGPDCATGEEWNRMSDGRVFKSTPGYHRGTIVVDLDRAPEKASPEERPKNRHERRAAAKRARSFR